MSGGGASNVAASTDATDSIAALKLTYAPASLALNCRMLSAVRTASS
jgi:hypothetical protein